MTEKFVAPYRKSRQSQARDIGKEKDPDVPANVSPELEHLGWMDHMPRINGAMEVRGPVPDKAFLMSEPDFELEDHPRAKDRSEDA